MSMFILKLALLSLLLLVVNCQKKTPKGGSCGDVVPKGTNWYTQIIDNSVAVSCDDICASPDQTGASGPLLCDQNALSSLTNPSDFAEVLLSTIDTQSFLLGPGQIFASDDYPEFQTEAWICLDTVVNRPDTEIPIMPFAFGKYGDNCKYSSLPTSASCSQPSGGKCNAVSSFGRRICPCTANNANTKKSSPRKKLRR